MIPWIFPLLFRIILSAAGKSRYITVNLTRHCVDAECDHVHDLTETGGLVPCFRQNADKVYQYGETIFPMRQTNITYNHLDGTMAEWTEIHCARHKLARTHWGEFYTDVDMPEYCVTLRDGVCEECPIGSSPLMPGSTNYCYFYSGYLEACGLERTSRLQGEAYYIKQHSDAMEIAISVDPTCPHGFYQGAFDKDDGVECNRKCMQHCLRCRTRDLCLQCDVGYLPSFGVDGRISVCIDRMYLFAIAPVTWETSCPGGYIPVGALCYQCQRMYPKCRHCASPVGCIECDPGYISVRGHYGTSCVPLCTRGQYYDATTGECRNCPPWCRHCDDTYCLECATGLYSLPNFPWPVHVTCRYTCPLHYYPINYFPYRCEPCHPSCWGCTGPSDEECLDCKTAAIWDPWASKMKCDGTLTAGTINAVRVEQLLRVREEVEARYIRTHDNFAMTPTSAMIFVPVFDREELPEPDVCADCQFCGKDSVYEWLVECATCKPSYWRDFRGHCGRTCPNSTFKGLPDRCVPCHEPYRCNQCRWDAASLEKLARDTTGALLDADYSLHSDIGIDQVCDEPIKKRNVASCDPIAHFEDQQGHCRPCHRECLGCSGYGPAACKKCRHGVRDAEGRCVPECHPKAGYHMTTLLPGMNFCFWEPLSSSHLPPNYAPKHEFRIHYAAVDVGVELAVIVGFFGYFFAQALAFYVSLFHGELDDADLICWRYEDIVQEAALRELEYMVFLRKTRTGSSSSFGPTHTPPARSSDTVPAVPSSSSNSKKLLGPLAEPKRVIVRQNLRTQARLNMRLKRNLELRKEEANKRKAKTKSRSRSLSLGTTQESHQGTLDAKSFTRETGTGERTGTRTTMFTTERPTTMATMQTIEQPAPATPHTSERRTSASELVCRTACASSTELGSASAPALAASTSGDISPPNANRSATYSG